MNGLPPIDAALSLSEATQPDVIRQKLDMDALRMRLGDPATKEEKLREACEGFEAIFLQKMWEQMRKTVPKEGFLHSKDEETYQSLFDIELCKKMASAGGIGLGDMLYQQLSQQLENTGRTTTPSSYRTPLNIAPTTTLLPQPAVQETAEAGQDKAPLRAEDLYGPLPADNDAAGDGDGMEAARQGGESLILSALDEIKADLGLEPKEKGVAAREWAEARKAATGSDPLGQLDQPDAPNGPDALVAGVAAPDAKAADGAAATKSDNPDGPKAQGPEEARGSERQGVDPALLSWQGAGPVSASPRPFSPFAGRVPKTDAGDKGDEERKNARRGMAPEDTLWPLEGGGVVAARFGWEDDPATGKRRWNSGVRIDAAAGTPVRAVLDGTVVYAGQRDGVGNSVVLEHKNGYRSYYGNLMPFDVKIGDRIKHGAEFAKIASQAPSSPDGEKTASLHFELKKGEMALNPEIAIPRVTTASR